MLNAVTDGSCPHLDPRRSSSFPPFRRPRERRTRDGGGIPVVFSRERLVGIDAVIDKDLTSSLLASELEAELLLISTSVDRVALNYGTPGEQPLGHLTASEARRYLREGQLPSGSMGPKIEAALGYLEHGNNLVIITSPQRIAEALHALAGTRITPTLRVADAPRTRDAA